MRLVLLAFALVATPPTLAADAAPATATPPVRASSGAKAAAPVRVRLTTTDGAIVLELDPARAPITVANFLQYVRDKHYDGTIFHRVMPDFMAQGGGFTTKFEQKPTRPPIKLEVGNGLTNQRGTVAMARSDMRDSATSQFFINLVDNSAARGPRNLDTTGGGYAVFGRVVEGMEVVDKIAAIPTGPGGPFNKSVPFRNVVIIKAEVLGAAKIKPAAKAAEGAAPARTP